MTQLPMDFLPVLQSFAHPEPLRVWDAEGAYDAAGRWVESDPVERDAPVQAIVLATGARNLEFSGEGEASGGGISITTSVELYFTDAANLADDAFAGEIRTRQSYVLYKHRRYRVTGSGLTSGNANVRIYYALRHML